MTTGTRHRFRDRALGRRLGWIPGLALALLVSGLPACGGALKVRPECREEYDACVNNCALRCDQHDPPVGPGDTDWDATYDTWTLECQTCESTCRDLAERCDERAEN